MTFHEIRRLFRDDGLGARAIRGSALTFFGFGGAQFLRLASNLILTRILFPEAFGLMALVQVFMVGLQMFSDTGIGTSILQSKRGDDPDFLNTAWTVDILRSILIWVIILLSAGAVSRFYEQPQLAQLLPVAGLVVIVQACRSTKMVTANRHLLLGRVTVVDLVSQALGIIVMIVLALIYESVWALVIGGLVGAVARTLMSHFLFPGTANRIQIERSSFWELFHFGKFIFVASIAGFLVNYADRAILGKFISIGHLGIYNIAFFLGTVPIVLARMLGNRVMIPIYRETPPAESKHNAVKARKARLGLTTLLVLMGFCLSLLGEFIIQLLYDPTYHLAGPILVLLALAYMPAIVINSYSALFLSSGDSRTFTTTVIVLAAIQTTLLLWGVSSYGILGAVLAPGVATLLAYPAIAFFAKKHGGLDLPLDLAFFAFICAGTLLVLTTNPDSWLAVLHGSSG